MRPEPKIESLEAHVAALNAEFADADALDVLRHVVAQHGSRAALVSSFGAESVVLLHMLSEIDRAAPVLFIDTEMLFAATLDYQVEVAEKLGLTGVRRIHPDRADLFAKDPDGDLHRRAPDLCCDLRKTRPLEAALGGFDVWVTGRKRHQTGNRAELQLFEADERGRIKVNPLAGWTRDRLNAYIDAKGLPRHPLVKDGFLSIGCAPCTSRVKPGEDPRAGRWRGTDKEECGIHFVDGQVVRGPAPIETPVETDILVTDEGFRPLREAASFVVADELPEDGADLHVDVAADQDPEDLAPHLHRIEVIRVPFASFADGRGFTLAREFRRLGFGKRLRAAGHVISDQYRHLRRVGFDEVQIDEALAKRQPEENWRAGREAHPGYLEIFRT